MDQLHQLMQLICDTQANNGSIYIFGNGGSGANASHIAGDYVKGASHGLQNKFRFICLNDNYTAFAAAANDIDYSDVFKVQLETYLQPQDLVIGLTGSGNSPNIVKALEYAQSVKVRNAVLCGFDGGVVKNLADFCLHVPIHNMEIIEDLHLSIFHMIKQQIIKMQQVEQAAYARL